MIYRKPLTTGPTAHRNSRYKKCYSLHSYYYSYVGEEGHSLFYSRKFALNAFSSPPEKTVLLEILNLLLD